MIVDQDRYPGVVFAETSNAFWESGTVYFSARPAAFEAARQLQLELLAQGFVVRDCAVSGQHCQVRSISVIRPRRQAPPAPPDGAWARGRP